LKIDSGDEGNISIKISMMTSIEIYILSSTLRRWIQALC